MADIKYHQFLQDVNFDFDQKTLIAFITFVYILIVSTIVIIYGLAHDIKSASLISALILGLLGLIGTLLASGAFQKPRDPCENKNE